MRRARRAAGAQATGSQGRGTRLRAYFKENGYDYFQGAIVWVVDGNSSLNRGQHARLPTRFRAGLALLTNR